MDKKPVTLFHKPNVTINVEVGFWGEMGRDGKHIYISEKQDHNSLLFQEVEF